jgi:hypothetical protein
MKIVFEVLDRGCLVTAEDKGVTERLAYESPGEALIAVADALEVDLGVPRRTSAPVAPVAPAAPMPEPELAPEQEQPPPSTRRIGLMQPRKSAPPAGRRPSGV